MAAGNCAGTFLPTAAKQRQQRQRERSGVFCAATAYPVQYRSSPIADQAKGSGKWGKETEKKLDRTGPKPHAEKGRQRSKLMKKNDTAESVCCSPVMLYTANARVDCPGLPASESLVGAATAAGSPRSSPCLQQRAAASDLRCMRVSQCSRIVWAARNRCAFPAAIMRAYRKRRRRHPKETHLLPSSFSLSDSATAAGGLKMTRADIALCRQQRGPAAAAGALAIRREMVARCAGARRIHFRISCRVL